LIEQADKQWSDFLWEFESGKRALDVDAQAFDVDANGKPILPNKRLYRTYKDTSAVGSKTLFNEWTPTLREQNLINGLDAILNRIEFNSSLAYGTLTTVPQHVEATATERKQAQQRSYRHVANIQKSLQNALDGLLYGMDAIAGLYKLAPAGRVKASYYWDDSIVSDHDTQFTQDSLSVSQGTMSRVEFRVRNYGETEEVARERIARIDAEQSGVEFTFTDEATA